MNRELQQRITDYLSGGGLFNPELANHDAVRDLLIDCRDALHGLEAGEPVAMVVDSQDSLPFRKVAVLGKDLPVGTKLCVAPAGMVPAGLNMPLRHPVRIGATYVAAGCSLLTALNHLARTQNYVSFKDMLAAQEGKP